MQKLKSFLAGLVVSVSALSPAVLAHDEARIGSGVVLLLVALAVLFLLKKGK